MSKAIFTVMPVNPNKRGGACACSPQGKVGACLPPYIVWHASESMDARNPQIVTCLKCVERAAAKAQAKSAPHEKHAA